MVSDPVMRYQIADYLGVLGSGGGETYELMGVGFNTLDESPAAQTDSKTYINEKAQTTRIKAYNTQFPFDTDLIKSEKAVMELYGIGRNQKIGADAERNYVRVELFESNDSAGNSFKARKFRVAVQVDSVAGEGGGTVKVTGNLNGVGEFVEGTFNTKTRTFTPLANA